MSQYYRVSINHCINSSKHNSCTQLSHHGSFVSRMSLKKQYKTLVSDHIKLENSETALFRPIIGLVQSCLNLHPFFAGF